MGSPWLEKCLSCAKGADETLADMLHIPMQLTPDKVAIYFEDRQITYSELDISASVVANALINHGVQPGDRVAIHVDNRPEFIFAFLGAMRAGAILVATSVMYTTREMEHILADSGSKVLFILGPLASKIEPILSNLPALELVIELGPPELEDSLTVEEFIASSSPQRPEVAVAPEDVAIIQYTSGTTGEPKGAMLTHKNVIAILDAVNNLVGVPEQREDDVVLLVLPLFHVYALSLCLEATFRASQSLVLEGRFDAERIFSQFQKHKVAIFYGAPPMYHAFINTPGLDKYDLSSLRIIYSGAAPLPLAIFERFKEMYGIEIFEGYGLSETAALLTTNSAGEINKPGSVGCVIDCVEMKVVDDDDNEVATGENGEVIARGANIFKGYWGHEDYTAEAMRGDWFHTGDMGHVDKDGYYYLVDRKQDMIIVSGFNVYPVEVENIILHHPKVKDCAVIGVHDEHQGECVKAVVVLHPGEHLDPNEIIEHCSGQLARFKVPKSVSFHDSLPKSLTGKVVRRILREQEAESKK